MRAHSAWFRNVGLAVGFGVAALATGEDAVATSSPPITHSFLVTGARTCILEFASAEDKTGKVTWQYPGSTRDGWVLANDNLLLAVSKSDRYPGGAAVELTRDGKIVFEYKGTQDELNSVQKLANGNIVVTEAGPKPRLLELDATGKTVVEFDLDCQKQNFHMQTRMARKLAGGTYLVPHLLDFAVKEYDASGKVLKSFDTAFAGSRDTRTWPFTAIRLDNGNTLIGCTNGNRVVEVDATGKPVWQLTNEDLEAAGIKLKDCCGVQRLPNGNTVVTSYAAGPGETRLVEVTREKKVVWTYSDRERHGIHHFQILDTNGKPLPGPPLK